MPRPRKPRTPRRSKAAAREARPASAEGLWPGRVSTGRARSDIAAGSARAFHRVAFEDGGVRTDASALPETPRESGGLLELVSAVARRALALGLSARERSFHVFVAAEPEVMIEGDIVRFAR